MANLGLNAPPAIIDGLFTSFDLDMSGAIDMEELQAILRQKPEPPSLLTRSKFQRTLRPPPKRTIVQTPRPVQLPAVPGVHPAGAQAAGSGAQVGAPSRVGGPSERVQAVPTLPQLPPGRVAAPTPPQKLPTQQLPPQQLPPPPPQQPHKGFSTREDLATLALAPPGPAAGLQLPGLAPTRAGRIGFGQTFGGFDSSGVTSPLKSSLKPTRPQGERPRGGGGGRRVRVREAAMEDDLQWFKKNTPRGDGTGYGGIRAEYQLMASLVTV